MKRIIKTSMQASEDRTFEPVLFDPSKNTSKREAAGPTNRDSSKKTKLSNSLINSKHGQAASNSSNGSKQKTASSSSGQQTTPRFPSPDILYDFDIVVNNDTLLWLKAKEKDKFEPDEEEVMITLKSLMKSFLYPISVAEFEEHIFHKRAFAVTGLGEERIQKIMKDLYCYGNPESLIDDTASEDGVSIWLRGADAIKSFKTDNKDMAKALLKSKTASIYMRAPPETCQQLTMWAYRGLNIPLGMYPDGKSRGEVEVFLANGEESRKTPTHTDFQENFTIQLRGHKIWQLHLGDVRNPIRAKAPHFANTPDSVKVEQMLASQMCGGSPYIDPPASTSPGWATVELGPGDILYHPPGIWHNVQTSPRSDPDEINEINLSTNISLVAPTWAELLGQAVRQLCTRNEILRRPVSVADIPLAEETIKKMGLSLGGHLNHLTSLVPSASIYFTARACKVEDDSKDYEEDDHYDHSDDDDDSDDDDSQSSSDVFVLNWSDIHRCSLRMQETIYTFNRLALLAIEKDLNPDEEDDEEDSASEDNTFNVEVHVNKGTDDLESVCTFQLTNIPREILPALIELRAYAQKHMHISSVQMKDMFGDSHYRLVINLLCIVGYFDLPFREYQEVFRNIGFRLNRRPINGGDI